ncbi:hypothetical protein EDD85DRAFT_822527 [Armillaria nabsnona]|nr:hypothetical protein EDD85DRAFT_822527 [Armillaria nabsnona]
MAEFKADSYDPRPPLELRSDRVGQIAIFHPVRSCPILAFGRRQKVNKDGQECLGIRHWFVLDACLVVAGKGFLSSTKEPTGRVNIAETGFLTRWKYWYFLDDTAADLDYPICKNFLDWKPLPREEVPQRWLAIDERDEPTTNAPLQSSSSDISLALKNIDKQCAISGLNEELRACHLVPQACAEWYAYNLVHEKFCGDDANYGFSSSSRPVDDIRQILTLESGLHDSMDRPSFVIAPSPPSDKYVCFFFVNRSIGLAEDYHMRTVKIPSRIQGYALFARFAWAMIKFAFPLQPLQTSMKKGKRKQEPADRPGQSPSSRRRQIRGSSPVGGNAYDGGAGAAGPSSTGNDELDQGGGGQSRGGAGLDDGCATFHTGSDSDLSLDDVDCDTDDSLSDIHDVSDGGRLELDSAPVDYLKEQEQQLTANQIQRFHDAEEGIKPFSSFVYNSLEYYPGYSHIEELKQSYVATHPAVSEIGEPTTDTRAR